MCLIREIGQTISTRADPPDSQFPPPPVIPPTGGNPAGYFPYIQGNDPFPPSALMPEPENTHTRDPRIFETLKSDIGRGDFFGSVRREFRETREFLLDEQRRQRLGEMHILKRFWLTAWWMLKGMFFRLTPVRRLLFVIGIVLIAISRNIEYSGDRIHMTSETSVVGIVCIILVLMLELKDKLLAKEELEAGRAVQDALAPQRSPELAGWNLWLYTKSANEVGGDLVACSR
jgi:hypothetical protein